MNKTHNKKEISPLVAGRQSMFYKLFYKFYPVLTVVCGIISVLFVGVVLWMVLIRISWNIPEDLKKFIDNGLFSISSLAGLSVTCFTAFLAVLIYLRQKQHAEKFMNILRYGNVIRLDGLLLLISEWIENKKASRIFCLSNYSQIPGFWLPVEYAAKIHATLEISETSKNKLKILLFGPNEDEFEKICTEAVLKSKRWEGKSSQDVIKQYNKKRMLLNNVNNIYFGSLLPERGEMPVNILILAEIMDDGQGRRTSEVVYGFKKTTNPGDNQDNSVPDCLAQFELRHATDDGLYQIVYSLARALTPEEVWREALQEQSLNLNTEKRESDESKKNDNSTSHD